MGQESNQTASTGHQKMLKSMAQSTSYTIGIQLMFRILTFVVNAVIFQYVSTDLIGVANVRLEVLHTTIDILAKDPVTKSCLTKTEEERTKWKVVINMAWLAPLLSIPLACLLAYIWMYWLEAPDPITVPYYSIGVATYALTAILKSTCLPFFIVGQKLLYVRFKALIEGLALLLKFLGLLVLVTLKPEWGLINFCIGKVIYATVYTFGYIIFISYESIQHGAEDNPEFPLTVSDFKVSPDKNGDLIDRNMLTLTTSFLKQSFLKQILTEGEKYMMTIFNMLSFSDQGVFDVVSNLGSLICRFFFMPLEESSYLLFSQSIVRGKPASQQDKENVNMATSVLVNITKMVMVASLVILVFGYSYSQLLLRIYGGAMLSSGVGPVLMRWYCLYVLTLALNGITECFSFATMSKAAVDSYNYKMLAFSVLFLVAAYVLTGWIGAVGFILANCLNMSVRIVHSVYQIEVFYSGSQWKPVSNSTLSPVLMVIYAVIAIVLSSSEVYFGIETLWSIAQHIAIGVICLLVLAASLYTLERDAVRFIYQHFLRPLIKRHTHSD